MRDCSTVPMDGGQVRLLGRVCAGQGQRGWRQRSRDCFCAPWFDCLHPHCQLCAPSRYVTIIAGVCLAPAEECCPPAGAIA